MNFRLPKVEVGSCDELCFVFFWGVGGGWVEVYVWVTLS
jgi:hypothetical protein